MAFGCGGGFHPLETGLEFAIGFFQRDFGVGAQEAGDVYRGEEEIADFFFEVREAAGLRGNVAAGAVRSSADAGTVRPGGSSTCRAPTNPSRSEALSDATISRFSSSSLSKMPSRLSQSKPM